MLRRSVNVKKIVYSVVQNRAGKIFSRGKPKQEKKFATTSTARAEVEF